MLQEAAADRSQAAGMLRFLTQKLRYQSLNEICPLSHSISSNSTTVGTGNGNGDTIGEHGAVCDADHDTGITCHSADLVVAVSTIAENCPEEWPAAGSGGSTGASEGSDAMTVVGRMCRGNDSEQQPAPPALPPAGTDSVDGDRDRAGKCEQLIATACCGPPRLAACRTTADVVNAGDKCSKRKRQQQQQQQGLGQRPVGSSAGISCYCSTDSSDEEVQELLARRSPCSASGPATVTGACAAACAAAAAAPADNLESCTSDCWNLADRSPARATTLRHPDCSGRVVVSNLSVTEVGGYGTEQEACCAMVRGSRVASPRKRHCAEVGGNCRAPQTGLHCIAQPSVASSGGCGGPVPFARPSLDLEKMHQKAAAMKRHYPRTIRIRCWNGGSNLSGVKPTVLHDPADFLFRSIETKLVTSPLTPVERPPACSV